MNKKTRRLFSLLLAFVMILTAIPMTSVSVSAANATISISKWGICRSANDSDTRLNNAGTNTVQIINDKRGGGTTWQTANKANVAFWVYNISGIPQNSIIDAATLHVEATATKTTADKYTDFFWIPQSYLNDTVITESTSPSGKESQSTAFMQNLGQDIDNFYQNFKNHFNNPALLMHKPDNGSVSLEDKTNIKNALSQAIANGDTSFILAALKPNSYPASGEWSDTNFKIPTISVNYSEYQQPLVNNSNVDETTAGRVNIGNVIYTSASDNTKNYGTHISETDPYSTPITYNGSQSPEKIEVVDDNGNRIAQLYISAAGKLSGDMSDAQFRVENKTDVTANLKFTFSGNKVEYHRVAVKSVPVEAHLAMTTQTWNAGQTETSYEIRFVGSYGSIDKMSQTPSGTESHYTGNWDELGNIQYAGTTTDRGGDYYAQYHMDQDDKIAGYATFRDQKDAPTNVVPTARYYIDKSNLNLANGNLWSNNQYKIPVLNSRWVRIYKNCKAPDECYLSVQTSPSTGAFDRTYFTGLDAQNNNDHYTINYVHNDSINTNASETNVVYRIRSSANYIEPKAKLAVNVFDKSTTRNAYNTAIENITDATGYTRTAYTNYINALLETEAYLSNFEKTDTSITTYKDNLTAAYNKINSNEGLIGDVNKIITAAKNAYNELDSSTSTDNKIYTTSSREALENVLSSLTYVNQNGSNFTSKVTQPREFSKAMEKADTDRITNAVKGLVEAANFSDLDTAYNEADTFLKGLNGKDATYTASAVNDLIKSLDAANGMVSKPANEKADTAKVDSQTNVDNQNKIDTFKNAITDAKSNLETSKPNVSLEAYNAKITDIDTCDRDVINLTKEQLNTIKTNLENSVYGDITYGGATIKVFKVSTTQDVDTAITAAETEMNGHKAVYNLTVSNATSSLASNQNVPYGTQVTFTADNSNADTAWYMSYQSNTANRSLQYQGTGATFTKNVFGNITVEAHSRNNTDRPNKVTITSKYDKPQPSGIQLVDFVGSTFTLPQPSAAPGYAFQNYTVDGQEKAAGDTITLSGDTSIVANYKFNAGNYTVTINGTNQEKAYNDSIKLTAADGQVWVQDLGEGQSRLFSNNASTTMFVTEGMTLTSVDKSDLTTSNYENPIYLRSQTMSAEGKVIFNGQVAVPDTYTIKEFGVLIGKPKSGGSITAADVAVENAGSNDKYRIMRAKSTKTYGTNQFTIKVSNLDMANVIYKGYIIYEDDHGKMNTVYTEAKFN